jgi:ParB-like chromosome segregation protein Spo0J
MNKPIQVQQTPVDALIPFARNARTHSDEQVKQIAASIREFGFNNPILIRDDLTVIAGHGRLAAAKVLGLKEVPTISLAHLTPLQVRAYVLADNKLALNAGWDDEMLALELQELALEGFDVALTGFDEVEIGALLADKTEEGLMDEDAVPEVPERADDQDGGRMAAW